MDSLPPNDPNNNRNNNNNRLTAKEIAANSGRRGARGDLNENGEMEIFGGNQGDQAAIFALFLMGVASWILREHCIC